MSKVKEVLGAVFGAIWKWLKDNWLPLLLVLAVVGLFAKGCDQVNSYNNLFEQYQQQSEDHERQLQELRSIQESEREALDRQLQEYMQNMDRIEREYKDEIDRISRSSRTRQSDIIRNHDNDPDTLTEAVHAVFGIPVE